MKTNLTIALILGTVLGCAPALADDAMQDAMFYAMGDVYTAVIANGACLSLSPVKDLSTVAVELSNHANEVDKAFIRENLYVIKYNAATRVAKIQAETGTRDAFCAAMINSGFLK